MVVVGELGRCRVDDLDRAARHDVGEVPCQLGQRRRLRHLTDAEDERAFDEPHRVVVGVEAEHLVDRAGDVVGDVQECEVLGGDVAAVSQLVLDEREPGLPVGAARHVEQHHGRRLRLAGLQQGQQLEGFVEGAETAGKQHERVGFLDELELAGEEVPEAHQLRVAGQELPGRRLEGELDTHPERVLGPGALDARLHDPRPGAGHDHPVGRRQRRGELSRLLVERVVGLGAGGAEDRHLARGAVGREDRERVTHLLQRGVGDLEVASIGAVTCQPERRRDELEDEVAVGGFGRSLDDRGNGFVERSVAGSIAGELHHARLFGRHAAASPLTTIAHAG